MVFAHSEVNIADVRDGMSNTILLGEKYVMPESYDDYTLSGGDWGEDGTPYAISSDNTRWTLSDAATRPRQDRNGDYQYLCFGSAHPGGFSIVLCDGSVRNINYSIDLTMYSRLGNRNDKQPVDLSDGF